jgi:hypothetical protein
MITVARPAESPSRREPPRPRPASGLKAPHPGWTMAACLVAGIALGWLVKRRPS